MVRLRQPTPRQLKAVLIDVLMPKGRGVQAQTSKIQTQTSQIQVQTSKIQFIVLFTNWLTMRDLKVLVPPNFMVFRRASFWTCPKKHTYTILLNFLGRLGLGWGRAGVGTGLVTGMRH